MRTAGFMTIPRNGAWGCAAVHSTLTAALVMAAVALPVLASTPAGNEAKASRHVSTLGPPVPQSAAQRAALAAKRATTISAPRVTGSAATKPAPISTIPGNTAAMGRKATAPITTTLVPSAEARRVAAATVRRAGEEAAIAAFLAAHGPEIGRQAGLVKAGERGAATQGASR